MPHKEIRRICCDPRKPLWREPCSNERYASIAHEVASCRQQEQQRAWFAIESTKSFLDDEEGMKTVSNEGD